MKAITDMSAIFTLHRYFIWANRIRDLFEDTLEVQGPVPDTTPEMTESEREATESAAREWFLPVYFYGSYWLASLYVVVEGWGELGLSDPKVDELLVDEFKERLRRHRNATFHYQATYLDKRVEQFITEHDGKWVGLARGLHDAISDYFLKWMTGRGHFEGLASEWPRREGPPPGAPAPPGAPDLLNRATDPSSGQCFPHPRQH